MKPDFSFKLKQKVLSYIKDNDLIRHGDVCIVGLSGGADSVCLILLLNEIKKQLDFELHALHVNHGIRGIEAANDEAFSKKICEELSIPFKAFSADVPAISKNLKLTLEEAGRNARYEAFKTYANEIKNENNGGNIKVALAHHMDDQAETVIFNMVRGSGLKGMGGIDSKKSHGNITVIRPLLCISREEIESYLKANSRDFCIDKTNYSNEYSRNIIRNKVIPCLNEIQPQSSLHISKTAGELKEAETYINKMMLKLYEKSVNKVDASAYSINVKLIKNEEPLLIRYLIIHIIKQLVDTYKDVTRTHIEDIYSLINKGKGKHIMLPFDLNAMRLKDEIIIRRDI